MILTLFDGNGGHERTIEPNRWSNHSPGADVRISHTVGSVRMYAEELQTVKRQMSQTGNSQELLSIQQMWYPETVSPTSQGKAEPGSCGFWVFHGVLAGLFASHSCLQFGTTLSSDIPSQGGWKDHRSLA